MSLPPDFMQARVDAVKNRLDVPVCSLYQADEIREILVIVATSGLNQKARGAMLSFQQGLTGNVTSRPTLNITMYPAPMRSAFRVIWVFPWNRTVGSTGCW